MLAFVGRNQKLKDLKDLERLLGRLWVLVATIGITSQTPLEDDPLAARHEPSALEGWTFEVLDRKGPGSVQRNRDLL